MHYSFYNVKSTNSEVTTLSRYTNLFIIIIINYAEKIPSKK